MPGGPTWNSVLFGLGSGPRERPRIEGSEVFRGAGHAILRTKGEAGLSAALTFGPYGGFHGHLDKLSFVFFGHGRELGVDPGRAASQAYRLPIHRDWYKATLGHNAVVVDAQPQKPAEGKLERFACTDTHAAALARCDAAYEGLSHRRLLCMTPTYLVVVDELAADTARRFDWIYHNRGSGVTCAAARADGRFGAEYPGQEYVEHVKAGETDEAIRVAFAGEDVTMHLTVAGEPKTEIRIGDGVGASVLDRVPLAMVTRTGRAARFVAVLEPVAKDRKPAVTEVAATETPDGAKVTIRRGDATDTITLTRDGRLTVESGGRSVLTAK